MLELQQSEALLRATKQAMKADPSVIVLGEGVCDPKGIFGTTLGLRTEFGKERVFETPLAENMFTGLSVGMALNGYKPIITHQRVDFTLLALDQMVNNAAKWFYMFGGQNSVPLVVRMIIGRGWGQGAQHSQSLQALYAHIPGLKVVMPTFANDGAALLLASIQDPNPVIFIEHRWCHYVKGNVDTTIEPAKLGKAKVLKQGHDVTIVATSYMTLEAMEAAAILDKAGISAEVIDLRTIRPWDKEAVCNSAARTKHLIIADTGSKAFGITSEIATVVVEQCWDTLVKAPTRIATPDFPPPSSPYLAMDYYTDSSDIVKAALKQLDKTPESLNITFKPKTPFECDKPNPEFQGPF